MSPPDTIEAQVPAIALVGTRRWLEHPRSGAVRSAALALAFALATASRWLLAPLIGTTCPFVTYHPVVMFAMVVGGRRHAYAATLFGALATAGGFLVGDGSVTVEEHGAIAVFIGVSLLTVAMCDRLLRARSAAERDAAGATGRAEALLRELATRDALRATELRARAIFDHATDAIFVHRADGRIVDANARACESLGRTREELLGMGLADIARSFDPATLRERLPALRPGDTFATRARHVRKDGSELPVDVRVGCFELGDERLYIGLARDVTESDRAAEQIRAQASLLDLANDAIIVHDMRGRVTFWNRGATRLFGWSAAQARGRLVTELHRADDGGVRAAADALERTGTWSGELQCRTADGRQVVVDSRWTRVCGADGEPTSVLVIDTDVTEKRRLEAQFFAAQRMESVGQLAGGVAHDFNNVLAAILLETSLLHDASAGSDALRDGLADIELAARRGAELTRQLLLFSRRQPIQPRPLDLNEVVLGLTKMLRRLIGGQIRLDVTTGSEPMCAEADAGMIEQVLLNLCVNARDAMPNGGRIEVAVDEVDVSLSEAARYPEATPGRYVRITVRDEGSGMDAGTLSRLFEPFFTTKPAGVGTGLGLATVDGIVKQHRGWITVESAPGAGSMFRVHLPSSIGCESDATSRPPPAVHGSTSETVLRVSDQRAVRRAAS